MPCAGQQANIILLDTHGIILDALKHVPAQSTSRRSILPGQLYQPLPLPPQRCLVSDLTVEALQQLQAQGSFDAVHLQRLVVGLSPSVPWNWCIVVRGSRRCAGSCCKGCGRALEQGTLTLSLCTTRGGKTPQRSPVDALCRHHYSCSQRSGRRRSVVRAVSGGHHARPPPRHSAKDGPAAAA